MVALGLAGCNTLGSARPTTASSTLYVRTDSDATTVVSPTVKAAAALDDGLSLEAGYTIDAWTGASIDVVTAATAAITETRQEADLGAGYERGTVRLAGRYRFSTESDYQSHGGLLGAAIDLAKRNTTLAVVALASRDRVGRAGDPGFDEAQASLGGRLTLTQVLGARTLAEASWDTTRVDGFQASPYRWVAIGGMGTCASRAPLCVPEHVPTERVRTALSARARRALGERWSTGLEYRLYLDSWGVRSHAIQPDLAWRIADAATLSLRYRYYTQGEADFYQPRYFALAETRGFVTRDRKLSAFFSHELGAAYVHDLEVGDGDTVISLGVRAGVSRLDYLAYVGLDHVYALDLAATAGLALE